MCALPCWAIFSAEDHLVPSTGSWPRDSEWKLWSWRRAGISGAWYAFAPVRLNRFRSTMPWAKCVWSIPKGVWCAPHEPWASLSEISNKWRRETLLLPGHAFQLPVPIELADDLRILAPVLQHFHVKLQENLRAQDRFQFLARGSADFLEGAAAAADQDSLLSFAVDVDCRADTDQLFGFVKRIADNGDGVWDFLGRRFHRLFPHKFRRKETFRLVRVLVHGELWRARGKIFDKFLQYAIDTIAFQRGNWNDLVELPHFRQGLDHREQLGFGDAVDLIEQ